MAPTVVTTKSVTSANRLVMIWSTGFRASAQWFSRFRTRVQERLMTWYNGERQRVVYNWKPLFECYDSDYDQVKNDIHMEIDQTLIYKNNQWFYLDLNLQTLLKCKYLWRSAQKIWPAGVREDVGLVFVACLYSRCLPVVVTGWSCALLSLVTTQANWGEQPESTLHPYVESYLAHHIFITAPGQRRHGAVATVLKAINGERLSGQHAGCDILDLRIVHVHGVWVQYTDQDVPQRKFWNPEYDLATEQMVCEPKIHKSSNLKLENLFNLKASQLCTSDEINDLHEAKCKKVVDRNWFTLLKAWYFCSTENSLWLLSDHHRFTCHSERFARSIFRCGAVNILLLYTTSIVWYQK